MSGQELIDPSHWVGALITSAEMIGIHGVTPVRALVNEAPAMIPARRLAPCLVVASGTDTLHAAAFGTPEDAWAARADVSAGYRDLVRTALFDGFFMMGRDVPIPPTTRRMTAMTSQAITAAPATSLTRALQVLAGLTVLDVLFQFVTAGQLFGDNPPDGAHGAGAIVLHVLSGLTALVAFLLWRRGEASLRLVVLAAVVFVASFVQAAIGGYSTLWAHVPGAMVLTVGVTWVFVVALRSGARR